MFYPLFCLLYLISKSMFRIIDGLFVACESFSGIKDIAIGSNPTDLLTYVLTDSAIGKGFRVTVIIGVLLVTAFAIAAIIRTIVKEKAEGTPWQIVKKAGKTVLEFLFVPFVMFTIISLSTTAIRVIYSATSLSDSNSIGTFLCGMCCQDGLKDGVSANFYLEPGFDYTQTGRVFDYCQYDEFDYFTSWAAGLAIIIALMTALMAFVDRAISIAILFIASPISISTAMIDDGAHFKLWRDQILLKFLNGFGIMIALNVYMIVVTAVMKPNVNLVPVNDLSSSYWVKPAFLNYLMKLVIIIGGAFSLKRIMGVIGNLVTAGGGSSEMSAASQATSDLGSGLKNVGRGMLMPLRGARALANFSTETKEKGLSSALAHSMGLKTAEDFHKNDRSSGSGNSSGNHNNQTPQTSSGENTKNALEGKPEEKKDGENKKDNQNGNKPQDNKKPNQAISNAILNSGNKQDKK